MLMLKAPRCLKEFLTEPTTDPGVELDAVVDEWENRFLSIACPCGGGVFTVRSFIYHHSFYKEDRAYGPITLRCTTCDRAREPFDPALHGYDVEIDHFPETGPYRGTLRDSTCPNCSAEAFSLIARFQYPENVMEPHQGAGSYVPASEDLFTYFTLIGNCAGCGKTVTIASVECA